MKTLVIYYSLDGSTEFIAKTIAEEIKADSLKLKTEKEPSRGFMKYLRGGKQVLFKEKPNLKKFDKNPEDYEVLFIGTPVWSGNHAPALRSFLSQIKLKNKKIALFCCCGSGKGKSLENMKQALKGNKIMGEMEFVNVLKNKEKSAEEIKLWMEILKCR